MTGSPSASSSGERLPPRGSSHERHLLLETARHRPHLCLISASVEGNEFRRNGGAELRAQRLQPAPAAWCGLEHLLQHALLPSRWTLPSAAPTGADRWPSGTFPGSRNRRSPGPLWNHRGNDGSQDRRPLTYSNVSKRRCLLAVGRLGTRVGISLESLFQDSVTSVWRSPLL